MADKRFILGAAAAVLLSGLVGVSAAYAQQDDEQQSLKDEPTRKTPALSQTVYQPLSKAQECADMKDYDCAMKFLSQVREMKNKNSYETALMWQFYAFVYFSQEKTKEAMTAYENLLKQPDLPLGLEQQTRYTLAQLYVQEEDYQKGLDMLDKWFAISDKPSPGPYVLKANIYYQLQQYKNGIEPIKTALKIAEEQGSPPEEGWYQLLNVFYFELEDYSNVVKTLTYLANHWPKKDYFVQLAGVYGQQGNEDYQVALYQAANAMNWLERGGERVTLAQMLLSADVPYRAARILEDGLKDGSIESTESNWRTLAQAWQLAKNDEKAIPALTRAADLSDDGELNYRLANSYANLAQWDNCVGAARDALQRGGLNRPDQANLLLGNCLAEQKKYDEARNAFKAAARDERSRKSANQWLRYLDSEENREAQLRRAAGRAG